MILTRPSIYGITMYLSVDLGFVATAVDLLQTHDIIVGSRKMGNQKRSLFRRLGSDSFLQATRLLPGLRYDYYSIAAKAFRLNVLRRFVDRITEESSQRSLMAATKKMCRVNGMREDLRKMRRNHDGRFYLLDICYLPKLAGGRITQVPVSCEDWRQSKFNLWHEAVHKDSHLVPLWLRGRRGVRG